jgi:hypothetical protein
MVNEEQLDRVWGIIERVGICMLTTRFAGGLRAQPLEAFAVETLTLPRSRQDHIDPVSDGW